MTTRVFRLFLLPALPPAFLLLLIGTVGRDLLVWDEWVVWGEMLARIKTGIFTLSDLWAQQNEQRNLPPRLVDLALLPFFRLNRFADYLLNFLLTACTCSALCRLYLKTLGRDACGIRLFAPAVLALFCFSLTQWETFLVGLNLSQTCTTLGITLGALLVAGTSLTFLRLLGLLAAGLLASFSIINGLFYWPVLLPAVAAADGPHRRARVLLWLFVGAACWAGYFYGYVTPGHHPGIAQSLAQPLRLLGYFFTTLGAACVSDPDMWTAAFGIGLTACLLLLRNLYALRHDMNALRVVLPWISLLLFALLTAGALSVGRSLYRDMGHALQSRYVTLCLPFWAALLALDAFAAEKITQPLLIQRLRSAFWTIVLGTLVITNSGLFFHLQERGRTLDAMHRELFRLQDEALLRRLFPEPAYLAARLPLFLEQRLSPYTGIRQLDTYPRLAVPPENFQAELRVGPMEGGLGGLQGFQLRGRAYDAHTKRAAEKLFLIEGERLVHAGVVENNGEFVLFLPVTQLAPGPHILRALTLQPNGMLFPLGEAFMLDFPEYTPHWPMLRKTFYFSAPSGDFHHEKEAGCGPP